MSWVEYAIAGFVVMFSVILVGYVIVARLADG